MLRRTIFGDVLDAVAPDFVSSQPRPDHANFRDPRQLAAERPGHPRFVFAHVPSPHPRGCSTRTARPERSPDVELYAEDPGPRRA